MRIVVNEVEQEVAAGATIAVLLGQLQLPGTRVAVEVNGQIVRRLAHATTPLSEGDRVEVVTLVGGG
jgi:sulfur carrier protein